METLFRFVLTRPPIAQDEAAPSIELRQNSDFQAALGSVQGGDARTGLKRLARQFVASPKFVGDPRALANGDKIRAFSAALDELESKERIANAELVTAVEKAFDKKPADVLRDNNYESAVASLRDSLIAIKYLPEEHKRPVDELTRMLRDLEVIGAAASNKKFPGKGGTLRRYRRRSVKLPSKADLRSSLSFVEKQKELNKQRKEEETKHRREAEGRLDLYQRLNAALDELAALDSDHLQTTPQRADPGFLVPSGFRPTQLLMQEVTQREQVSKLNLVRMQSLFTQSPGAERAASINPSTTVGVGAPESAPLPSLFVPGKGPFTPQAIGETAFRLKPSAERFLSKPTLDLLAERKLTISEMPLDTIVERLRSEVATLTSALDQMLGRPVQRSFKRYGNTVVMTSTRLPSAWNSLVVAGVLGPHFFQPINLSVPDSHGSVSAAGIADLLVVKQQLVRYEGADVAHIENVLKGEKKEREHTTRRQTEEFSFRETETTTTEERELESTSRFEMSRETSETIKEDASLKAGLTVSGKYGPVVEFSASAEGAISRSKEEATKSAATFSQDVTERSSYKITERILERTSLRIMNEVLERNLHAVDNVAGAGHIAGIYQWVNKVYQAQMFNYGIRMLYDFMVAEPAAFLIQSLQGAHAAVVELDKPTPFTLRPDQISESNYFTWIKEYGATDVQPPPEIYKTKSLDFKGGGGDSSTGYNHSGQIAIDDGYKAVFGSVGLAGNIWEETASLDVVLGKRASRLGSGWGYGVWTTSLDSETDSIPVALDAFRYSQIAVAVEVKCQRTDRAMLKWRLDTHAKLTTAYKARLSEYEEKLAALEVQAGVAIRGRNPLLNMELMNDELKKHCITIMTEQHFDLFEAVQNGSYNVPQLDIPENTAEGPYVRFFEQAFEWEQMTWLTYPYFWGRKSEWQERIAYEDVDPVFNQFLKAGYCRVVVPVRLGFEGAIDHFMTFGEIWNGGPLPTISNPLYLPIADEIAERLDRPGAEVPQGDPWFVRVPTTLVHLRPDDKLPNWQQNAAGEWVEA